MRHDSRRSIIAILWGYQFPFLLQRLDDLRNLSLFDTCDIRYLSSLEGFCRLCERLVDDFLVVRHLTFHRRLLLYVAF